jgi:hypothetical protein
MIVAEPKKKRRMGRPPTGKVLVGFKLTPELAKMIRENGQENSELVETAVRDWLGRSASATPAPPGTPQELMPPAFVLPGDNRSRTPHKTARRAQGAARKTIPANAWSAGRQHSPERGSSFHLN